MARYRCLPPCTHSTNSATIHQHHLQRCRYGIHMADDCWNTSCPRIRGERCTPVSDRYSRPCKHPKSTKHKPHAKPSAHCDSAAPRSTTARRNTNAPEPSSSSPPYTFYSIPKLPATCCHLCSAHFLTPDLLDRHIERHHTCPEPTCRQYPVDVWCHYPTYHVPDRGTKPCRFPRCRVRFPVYGRIMEETLEDIVKHMDSAHARCPLCDRYFFDSSRLVKHLAMSSLHQDQDLVCRCMDCFAEFKTFQSLVSHVCRIPCGDAEARCSAVFTNKASLEKHERRHQHGTYRKTTRDGDDRINCIACGRSFQGAAGMVSHLESGKCKSGVTRALVDVTVVAFDRGGVIHDPTAARAMIEAEANEMSAIEDVQRSKDGEWRCEKCPNRKPFKTKIALQRHLESPVHRRKVYHCPSRVTNTTTIAPSVGNHLDVMEDARGQRIHDEEDVEEINMPMPSKSMKTKRFNTLGGLTHHFEATGCVEKEMMRAAVDVVAEKMEALMIGMEKKGKERATAGSMTTARRYRILEPKEPGILNSKLWLVRP